MRYMLLIYTRENAKPKMSAEEAVSGKLAVLDETRKLGILEAADPLMPTSTATTVRKIDGKMLVLDGPFAETKEQLAGYYILDCKDLDEAIEWAKKIPTACRGGEGSIEIRPIAPLPQRSSGGAQQSQAGDHSMKR